MAPLCADNSNLMVYHMPMASSARSEASLMAIAQQLVQHQQQKQQLQHVQNQQQQQQQASTSSRGDSMSSGAISHWPAAATTSSGGGWQSKPEELAMPTSGFYSDVLYDFNSTSGSYFSEPTSVLDLPTSSLLLPPSVDSHIGQDSDFFFRDSYYMGGKPPFMGGFSEGMDMSYCKMASGGFKDSRFPDSFAKERAMGESRRGCSKMEASDDLSQSVTRVEEMGELVGYPPSTIGYKLPNLQQSMGFESAQASCRADYGIADAASEWMDCLMCDLQSDDAEEAVVSCFDTNPCESTESSEPPVATNGYPCTPEDALPDGFTVLEEAALCMRSGSDDVSPSWTQDTANEVLSSSPSCDLLSASSPNLISTNPLKRKVQEPQFMGQGPQALHGIPPPAHNLSSLQGGREADTRTWAFRRGDGKSGSLGEEAAIPKVEVKSEFEREGYQVPAHGVQLMQLLLECAKTVDNEHEKAEKVLPQLRAHSSRHGDPIQRLAAYFTEALSKRLARGQGSSSRSSPPSASTRQDECSPQELTLAYKALNDACPYFKFAQLTANQAILEAMEMADKVHIIDFGISQGVQWAALLQAFATRPGGKPPPRIRITGVASPALGGNPRESLLATGKRLTEFAKLLDLNFEFHPVAASMMEELECSMFRIEDGESVAVNFMLELCHLLGESQEPLMRVLKVAHSLCPKVVTLAEFDASLNSCSFQKRFVNALHFYSAMFDSLEATMRRECGERVKMERFLFGEKIESIVGCEGEERKERLEGRDEWRAAMEAAGFHSRPLSHYAVSQARLLLFLFCDSFTLSDGGGQSLSLGWQQRPLLTVSAWSSSSSSSTTSCC